MATRQQRTASGISIRAIRAAALVTIAMAAAACAKFPTAPDSAGMEKWNGEPVTTCVNGGCPTSGARARIVSTAARD